MHNAPDPLEIMLPESLRPDPVTAGYRAVRNGLLSYPPFQRALLGPQADPAILIDTAALTTAAAAHFRDNSADDYEHDDPQIQTSDLALFEIRQMQFDFNMWGPEAGVCTISQTYALGCATETMNVVPMNRIKFATAVALRRLGPHLGLGDRYVRDWRISNPVDNPGMLKDWPRTIPVYTAILFVNVEFYLDRKLVESMGDCP